MIPQAINPMGSIQPIWRPSLLKGCPALTLNTWRCAPFFHHEHTYDLSLCRKTGDLGNDYRWVKTPLCFNAAPFPWSYLTPYEETARPVRPAGSLSHARASGGGWKLADRSRSGPRQRQGHQE